MIYMQSSKAHNRRVYKPALIVLAVLVILAAAAGVALVLYLQSQGYHYPCVRCDPFGEIWTPQHIPWFSWMSG
jgi:hypothetical protein